MAKNRSSLPLFVTVLLPITTLLDHFALATLALSQFSNSMKHPDGQTIATAVSFAQNVLSWHILFPYFLQYLHKSNYFKIVFYLLTIACICTVSLDHIHPNFYYSPHFIAIPFQRLVLYWHLTPFLRLHYLILDLWHYRYLIYRAPGWVALIDRDLFSSNI